MITDPLTEQVRAENAELKQRLSDMEAKFEALMNGVTTPAPVDTGPRPQYRLIKPFYGPNDHFYDPDEGDEVIEWTGVPNDSMEAINEPAIKRMRAWKETLPGGGPIPLDILMEAAMAMRPKHGEDDTPLADFAGNVMRQAIKLRNMREGRDVPVDQITLPHKEENVPVMGGGRFNRKQTKEVIASIPQARTRPNKAKRVFGTGSGVNESPIEIG